MFLLHSHVGIVNPLRIANKATTVPGLEGSHCHFHSILSQSGGGEGGLNAGLCARSAGSFFPLD